MKKKRILVIAQTPPPFHGQSVMQQYLVDSTWGWCKKDFIRLDVSDDISSVGTFKIKKIIKLFNIYIRVIKYRLKGKIDLVYYPPASPNRVPFYRDLMILPLVRVLSKKIVFHFHAGGFDKLYGKLNFVERKLASCIYKRPNASIVLLQFLQKDIEWIKSEKVFVIPNGINICQEGFDPFAGKNFEVLFVGNIQREKGPEDLLHAIHQLHHNEGISVRTKFLGGFRSDNYKQSIEKLLRVLDIEHLVEFCGAVTGKLKWKYYSEAKLFSLPTFYETEAMPVTFLEAMSAGLPVITTNWRGNFEIIKENRNGLLVDINRPDQLAHAIKTFLFEESLYKQVKENNKIDILHYTIEGHLKSMEKIFKELVA